MGRIGSNKISLLVGTIAIVLIGLAAALLPWPRTANAQPRATAPNDKTASKAAKPATATPTTAAPGTVLYAVQKPGTVLYAVQKGDSTHTLLRKFWPQSSYMTTAEFLSALREANTGKISGDWPKPGVTLVIPGMEGPIVEKPVPMSKTTQVRAIYLTHIMAGSHNGLELIRRWKAAGGDAVVFDVKDSDGSIGIPFDNPLNPNTGRPDIPNLPKFVHWLHQQNLHVIARIAIFRDQRLVAAHPDLAVRSRRTGAPWLENNKLVWTDPSNPKVQDYNIALAMKAIEGGVDEIQFDYVRFPTESDQKDAKFEYESTHPNWQRKDVITDFLRRAYDKIHPTGDLFSLDVFGVMAWQRPVDLNHTGQDIPEMARHCDVLSPMIYPSHFFGMDGYAVPGDAPEHFIGESMDRFYKITEGTGVVLRPWLQAFHWRTPSYSPAYIETQVAVARAHDGNGFLFWNAANDYSKPFAAMPVMLANPDKYFGASPKTAAPAPPAKTGM